MAVRIELPRIAGMEPAILERRSGGPGILVIALERAGTLQEDLTFG